MIFTRRHSGADIEIKFAVETLKQLNKVWKRPVHLSARIDDEPSFFTFDGDRSSQEHIDENMDTPAHSF